MQSDLAARLIANNSLIYWNRGAVQNAISLCLCLVLIRPVPQDIRHFRKCSYVFEVRKLKSNISYKIRVG